MDDDYISTWAAEVWHFCNGKLSSTSCHQSNRSHGNWKWEIIFTNRSIELTIVVQPTTPTVADLSVKQDVIMHRVAALMSSLSDLKYRLALMEDPQVLLCSSVYSYELSLTLHIFLPLLNYIRVYIVQLGFSCSRKHYWNVLGNSTMKSRISARHWTTIIVAIIQTTFNAVLKELIILNYR